LLDRPYGMLTRRADAERRAGDEDRRADVTLVVEHEVAVVAPRAEQTLLEARALDALEPLGGGDLVGVDVAALERRAAAGDDADGFHDAGSSSSGVAKCPATAVAAATAGETRCVRPPRPCRPSKLRLLVLAARSPGASLSGFIAKHIEQPGSRQSAPAARNTSCSPSASA